MRRDRLLNLLHHRVGWPPPEARYRRMLVTPELLAFQVRVLRLAGYRFGTLRDAVLQPGRRAVVTFDDGYLDNLQRGLPVLERLGVPATVFVVSSDVGGRAVRWAESGESLAADLMGWDDLRRLQESGWEIGSHGHWHVHLDRHAPQAQRENVFLGRSAVERELGSVPVSFAYPYGFVTDVAAEAVRDAGFVCAVTTARGSNSSTADRYRLRRMPAGGGRLRHYLQALRLLWAS
ncbi:MAG: polysaccharide deacetylase family protein [Vicinamibacterales bacterium]|nr:polysaccharide deacetylase family protein [Vicinamibacterales bacterium]